MVGWQEVQAELLEERQVRQVEEQYSQVVPLMTAIPAEQGLTQLEPKRKNPLMQDRHTEEEEQVLQGATQAEQTVKLAK